MYEKTSMVSLLFSRIMLTLLTVCGINFLRIILAGNPVLGLAFSL